MTSSDSNSTGRKSQPGAASEGGLDSLVDQIAEAVRERLIQQGVPVAGGAAPKPSGASWQHLVHEGADRIGHAGESPFQPHLLQGNDTLAAKIDHTLLKPDATREEIQRVCEEARKHHFATVCVNSTHVGYAAELLKGSVTKAIAVVGFPLGAASTASKAFEARESIRAGAQEIDMVINIGALKGRDYALVLEDIGQVVEASRPYGVKVILETSNLTDDEKVIGCALSKAAGAAFVKTSTGFGSGGATADDIALMRRVVGPEMGVKASGGIRTYDDATKMIAAGASRIGASASVAIVTQQGTGGAASPKPSAGRTSLSNKKPGGEGGSAPKKPFKSSLY
jgi:deoxyribose-phosphate aldolase